MLLFLSTAILLPSIKSILKSRVTVVTPSISVKHVLLSLQNSQTIPFFHVQWSWVDKKCQQDMSCFYLGQKPFAGSVLLTCQHL